MSEDARNQMPLDPAVFEQLWDFDDPAASEQRMRETLDRVPTGSVAAQELATQIARALGLQERYTEADALLDGIDGTHPIVMTRVQLERGRLRNSSGDSEASRRHFSMALGHAMASRVPFLAVDAAHMLAIVEPDNASHWVRQGLEIIESSSDPSVLRWRGALYNNLGWTLHERREYEPALEAFRQALAAYEAHGTPAQVHRARWAVARCLRSLERYQDAMEIQRQLAEKEPADPYVQEEVTLLRAALEQR